MHGTRFTEEQIVAVLKEHAAGVKAEELCRGIRSASRRCTAGRQSTVASKSAMLNG